MFLLCFLGIGKVREVREEIKDFFIGVKIYIFNKIEEKFKFFILKCNFKIRGLFI